LKVNIRSQPANRHFVILWAFLPASGILLVITRIPAFFGAMFATQGNGLFLQASACFSERK
jgi:hypothetical protein